MRWTIAFFATFLTLLIYHISVIPRICIWFVGSLLIMLYILIFLNSSKPDVILKWFKLFLILHVSFLAIILICNSSDLALRLYPLDNIFINLFNNRLISSFYFYTLLASISLYVYSCILYNVKLKDSYSSYDYYLAYIYELYITYSKRVTWGLILNIILILAVYILLRCALIYYICFVWGVKPGIYIIYIVNITFMYILAFLYNKKYKLREEKPRIAILYSIFKTWILAILIFEVNLYFFGVFFIVYLWYIFFDDVTICHSPIISSFDNYSARADIISNQDNLSKLDKCELLTDEVNKAQNEINYNTIGRQLNHGIEMPFVELPTVIVTFNNWYNGLKAYTNLLFSSAGESAVQNNMLFSRHFPNSLGNDNLRFQPGFLEIQRIHALSVLYFTSEMYKVRYQWSLATYDLLSDPRDYPTYGPGSAKFRELESRDLEQYMFIKNIVQKLGNADFNSKIEDGATPVHHVLQSLQNHMHDIEKMAIKMDNLYTKSNKKFHQIREAEYDSLKPLIIKNVLDGHLPFFKSQGIVLPFLIVYYGDAS